MTGFEHFQNPEFVDLVSRAEVDDLFETVEPKWQELSSFGPIDGVRSVHSRYLSDGFVTLTHDRVLRFSGVMAEVFTISVPTDPRQCEDTHLLLVDTPTGRYFSQAAYDKLEFLEKIRS